MKFHLYHGTQPQVEQELLSLPDHPSSPSVFSGVCVALFQFSVWCFVCLFVLSSFMTYHVIFIQNYTMGATSETGAIYHSGTLEFTNVCKWRWFYSNFNFLCSILSTIVCLFALFLFSIVLYIIIRLMASDCHFDIFKRFVYA